MIRVQTFAIGQSTPMFERSFERPVDAQDCVAFYQRIGDCYVMTMDGAERRTEQPRSAAQFPGLHEYLMPRR